MDREERLPIFLIEAQPSFNSWPAVANEIRFRIRVANLDPEKSVKIHYSWDQWNSVYSLDASYVYSETINIGLSVIQSEIWEGYLLVPYQYKSIDFALCCTMLDQEWWDNNLGQNYQVEIPQA